MFRGFVSAVLGLGLSTTVVAQTSQKVQLGPMLDQAESSASLTVNGSPFHAQLKTAGSKDEPKYSGAVIVDWVSPSKFRLEVRSSEYHEVQIVDGTQVQDDREGDFYPGWLRAFVTALLNPMFAKSLLLDRSASLRASRSISGAGSRTCFDRDNRPGGITDEMTWSGVCISGDGSLLHVHTFPMWIDYSEQKDFHGKKIARKYSTSTGNYEPIIGKLISLVSLDAKAGEAISVRKATSPSERLGFSFISTRAEEARLESVKPFTWPAVREGRTDGFMIVDALTDVTGQVRETSKHNSDNSELEEAGRQAAMGYKFKPMLVDGVPVEMEMPLVLHFTSKVANPYPTLRGDELLKQIQGCDAKVVAGIPSGVHATPTEVAISEDGKLLTERFGADVDPGKPAVVVVFNSVNRFGLPVGFEACRFVPFKKDGVVTQYHGDLIVVRSR